MHLLVLGGAACRSMTRLFRMQSRAMIVRGTAISSLPAGWLTLKEQSRHRIKTENSATRRHYIAPVLMPGCLVATVEKEIAKLTCDLGGGNKTAISVSDLNAVAPLIHESTLSALEEGKLHEVADPRKTSGKLWASFQQTPTSLTEALLLA